MDASRDYLFGVLAVQAGFIESDRMRALLNQIEAGSKQRLPDLLREESCINEQQQNQIEDQVRRLLGERRRLPNASEGSESDENQANSENQPVSNRGSVEETIDSQPGGPDSALDETLQPSHEQGLRVSIETMDWSPNSRNRYTLTREHGRGGLGCVWLARDAILNREVALKEVIPGKKHPEERYKNLVREAQITGQLEHPNIVPVYELSSQEGDARPFYTMRFLRGVTLDVRIREYHKRRRAGEPCAMQLRELLDAFVAICHAIGYAHSRRIIHRDLKPSNVLLGEFGEVIVVDWGLAKLLSDPKDADVDMEKIVFNDAESYSQTREGTALGTPAYMAPEQARGHISLTDELTDIYGLGAILFVILTGKPPHLAKRPRESKNNTQQLLKRIYTLESPLARSFEPTVPRPLDAICGKAMARLRSERYKSADELARDVQRWLGDEPVTAYSERMPERTFRWLRAHRTFSLAMAAILLVLSIAGVTVAAVTMHAKNRIAESLTKEQESHDAAIKARDAERQAKTLALQQFRQAKDAIDRSLAALSEVITVFPGTENLQAELLRSVAADYQRLSDVAGDDMHLRREAARTRIRLADLRRSMNDFDGALQQYRRAQQEFETLQSEFESEPDWALDLAKVSSKLALLHSASGDHDEAKSLWEQAIAAYQSDFDDPELQREAKLELAAARLNQATLLGDLGRRDEAIELLKIAGEDFRTLISQGNRRRAREGLAMTQRELGELLQSLGENQQASEQLRAAESEYKRLFADDDEHQPYLEGLAHTRMLLANALRLLGDDLAPMRVYQSSVDDYLALLRIHPGKPSYRQSVAAGRVNIAQMLYKSARSRDAKVHLDEAIAELIDLTQIYPQVVTYRVAKAHCLVTLAMVLRDLEDDQLTDTAFAGGTEEFRWLSDDFPDILGYRGDLAISQMGWARHQEKLGELSTAGTLYRDAIAELTAVVENENQPVRYLDALAWCHFYLGEMLAGEEKLAAASTHLKIAMGIREKMPDLPEFRRSLLRLLSESSINEIRDPQRAIALAKDLCDQKPQNPDFRYSLAVAYLAAGDAANALLEATSAVELRSEANPFDLFVLAIAELENGDLEASKAAQSEAESLMQQQCPNRIELLGWQKRLADKIASSGR